MLVYDVIVLTFSVYLYFHDPANRKIKMKMKVYSLCAIKVKK